MPLYEYKCLQCSRHTEKIQKFSDPEITLCPHCGGMLERVISAPAISFKGGGWYADGYGNAKPSSSSESKDTATPVSSESKNTGGSGGKSASSSDGKSVGSSESSASAPVPTAAPVAAKPAALSSDKK